MFKEIDYNKHFVIGTPLVGWKIDRNEHLTWIQNIVNIRSKFPNAKFFVALELDSRGIEPYIQFVELLKSLDIDYWTYSINDFEEDVTFRNRWIRIETGRNLIREYAQRKRVICGHHWGEDTQKDNIGIVNYDAILYVDSDMILNAVHIEKMFEVDRPLVGINVPDYGLTGPVICENPRIEEHWTTAGMLLVNAPAYYQLVWGHNAFFNYSDDPSFQDMAVKIGLGQTWVRKDINALHMGQLVEVENRGIPKRLL
jgi:hypothetical protein